VSLDGLLTSETTYHYRLVGYNALGTSTGIDRTFTTPIAELPVIQGANALNVRMTSAVIDGEINPGFGDTSYAVQYGTSDQYGQRTVISQSIGDDGVFHPFSTELSQLSPGTTYHYRIIALNFKGTVRGSDNTFSTSDLPAIGSTSATVLGPTSAELSAVVVSTGTSGGTSVHFDYGTSTAYGARTPEGAPLGSGGGTATMSLAGLEPGTTYHFRAVATNAFGSTTGPDQSFTTSLPPATGTPTPPVRCRKGQVRKKGKCVKKKSHRNHRQRKHNRHGARG
jgi:hypothetical protein